VSDCGTSCRARFSWRRAHGFARPQRGHARRTIPSVRNRVSAASLSTRGRYGNIKPLSIDFPLRVRLRPGLTLIRLALIRKPWVCGVRVLHPDYRYLCLHFLLRALQQGSPPTFAAPAMLPYRPLGPKASVGGLMPDHFPRRASRPVSCYALFEWVAASKQTSWLSVKPHIV
jgi:hypothetical protein